jgi:hypothetical protein
MRFFWLLLVSFCANAHEMTPAYPKLEPSHVSGVYKASLQMFNRRSDVQFYEIGVFQEDWTSVPFVSSYTIIKLDYLGQVKFDVYIREEDVKRAVYICSKSKLRNDTSKATVISSRICSKIK